MILVFVLVSGVSVCVNVFLLFQAEDGIRDLVRSRGLGDVYKRQGGGRKCAGSDGTSTSSVPRAPERRA